MYIAPFLLSILFAHHVANWFYQASVVGYFSRTYGTDFISPHIQWFNPLFLALAGAAFAFLLWRQRLIPRLRAFNRYPTSAFGIAALAIALLSMIRVIASSRGLLPPTSPFVLSLGIVLSLVFKVAAVLAVWKAFQYASQANGPNPDQPDDKGDKIPWRTVFVLATGLHLLFPVRLQLVPMLSLLAPSVTPTWLSPYTPTGWGWVADFVAAALIAWYFIYRGTSDRVFKIQPDSALVRIAFWFAIVFLIFAPVAAILGAVPYGGGGVSKEVKSIVAVTQILSIFVIYRALVRGAA
jgi:hypothetical protein